MAYLDPVAQGISKSCSQGVSRVCSGLKAWLGEDPLASLFMWLLAGYSFSLAMG